MKFIILFPLIVFVTPLFSQTPDLSGDWKGVLNAGGATLNMILRLKGQTGTWESVDQHASIPVKTVQKNGLSVTIEASMFTYEGKLDATLKMIDGTFHQGSANLPLRLVKADGPVAQPAARPQEPARPFPYLEVEVKFTGGGNTKLAGTLTLPKGAGPFPAALLLTGSGAQDRDESLMGHKPFLVLSDYLTRLGFAVLRLDDRGTGQSEGVFATTTYKDKVADALAAIAFLKGRKEVQTSKIGIIGHSEGGGVGPLTAAESQDVAFVVMLAGMGLPGDQLLKQQGIDVVRSSGAPQAIIDRQVEVQTRLFQIARSGASMDEMKKQVEALIGPGPQAEQQLRAVLSPTIQDLLNYDPGVTLRKLKCPVLAMNGSKDLQVSAKSNLPAIAAALSNGETENWSTVELPGLNHLFQTAKTGAITEYSQIEETIAPLALKTLGDWLTRNIPPR